MEYIFLLQVNRGEESFELDDPRWCDVHVVSSLLKSFFRKLPDPLFTLVSDALISYFLPGANYMKHSLV